MDIQKIINFGIAFGFLWTLEDVGWGHQNWRKLELSVRCSGVGIYARIIHKGRVWLKQATIKKLGQ